jgi:hypothetical protein
VPPEFVDLLPMNPDLRDEMKRMIAWQLTVNNMLPPPGWQPGQPDSDARAAGRTPRPCPNQPPRRLPAGSVKDCSNGPDRSTTSCHPEEEAR